MTFLKTSTAALALLKANVSPVVTLLRRMFASSGTTEA